MYDELNVTSSKITNVEIKDNKIIITVALKAKYLDYIIDDEENIISGQTNHRIQKDYTITLEKEINSHFQGVVRYCENCGASMDINKLGICPYCRTTFNQAKHDYIITNIIIE